MNIEDIIKSFERLWKVKIVISEIRFNTMLVKCFTDYSYPHNYSTFLIDAMWLGTQAISYSTNIEDSPFLSLNFVNDFAKLTRKIKRINEDAHSI